MAAVVESESRRRHEDSDTESKYRYLDRLMMSNIIQAEELPDRKVLFKSNHEGRHHANQ